MIDLTTTTLLAGMLMLTSLTVGPQQESKPQTPPRGEMQWHVAVDMKDERIAIDPETGHTFGMPRLELPGEVSDDLRKIVFVERVQGGEQLHIADYHEDGSYSNARPLTRPAANVSQPQWMSDNRHVVYLQGSSGDARVYKIDTEASAITEVQLSSDRRPAHMPRTASEGSIAWLELQERDGKIRWYDLIVHDGQDTRTLAERRMIHALQWSPDGTKLAWSETGSITIHDLSDDSRQIIDVKKIDERLWNHHAWHMAWHPEGNAIAAHLVFSGGRSTGFGEEPEPLFGDRQVFVIPLDDPVEGAKQLDLPADVKGVSWTGIAKLGGGMNAPANTRSR